MENVTFIDCKSIVVSLEYILKAMLKKYWLSKEFAFSVYLSAKIIYIGENYEDLGFVL